MIESLKKTIFAGLGAVAVTRDRVLEGLEDLVKQGKISASEARETADRIAEDGKRQFEQVSAKVSDKFRDLASYVDGDHMRRLAALEARVAALEKKPSRQAKARRTAA
jgi:polyhydroxyalkanoate synthesis regulator phasin